MTTQTKKSTALILCLLMLTAVCLAAGGAVLSPALMHIEKEIKLQKCGVIGTDIRFNTGDFDDVLCGKTEFIRIDTLPDPTSGTLTLGAAALAENQLVAREDFEKLRFTPAVNESCTAQFTFSDATARRNETQVHCTVNILDEVNLAPAVGAQHFSTGESISAFKFLKAADPENDKMRFEVLSYPAHGAVRLSADSSGYFCYTPKNGYTGEDSFEYVAYDCYGNKSASAKVSVTVTKALSDVHYDDLEQHWAHNSAAKISAQGLMCGARNEETGEYNFEPDGSVSRGDFLAMALICAGKEASINFTDSTSFSDDAEIPVNIKSYAEYARVNGVISGYATEDGEAFFASTEPVTRAEAAVIVDRILSLPEASGEEIAVFTDCAAVPSWAGQAVANLTNCGIFNGTGYGELMPDSVVTRAETAEILCNMQGYLSETFAPADTKKPRTLLNLFGLLG